MPIIYTYPTKATPVAADTILISDSADSNATKKITVSSLTALGTGVSDITATSPIVASASTGSVALSFNGGLNNLSDVTIDGTSSYLVNVPSGLSGNPTANTILGSGAGNALTTGGNNLAVGKDAGNVLTTGSGNVLLGNNADASALGDNYAIAIGDGASAGQGGIAVGRNATAGAAELAIGNITLSSGENTGAATLPIKINGVQYYIRIYIA